MNTLPQQAEECNAIPTANNNNPTAFDESISQENVLIRGSEPEEEQELHEADKCNAKIHYFSRAIAKEHGIIPATILSGLAYKLKFHKLNRWKNQWWYYDSVETLRTRRWPYLSDGCISENTDYLEEKQLLSKDCNNQESYDRTVWYAMDDKVRAKALSDLVWFDVRVTKKLRNVLPGAIYHNLRYHLRQVLKQDPECPVPYHKFNQAMLARLLFVDVTTIKRWVKKLKEEKFILQHPKKRSWYTLVNTHEYLPIVASVNANGASANGASANANDALVNAIGASVNANDASVNDNTQYETNEKLVRNQSQKTDCVSVCSSSLNGKETYQSSVYANDLDHQQICDSVGSFPLRGTEKAEATPGSEIPNCDFKHANTFEQLLHQSTQAKELLNSLDESQRSSIGATAMGMGVYFVERHLPSSTILESFDTKNRNQLVQRLRRPFAEFVTTELPSYSVFNISEAEAWQIFYYPQLETLVRAFDTEEIWEETYTHTNSHLEDEVRLAYNALSNKVHDEVQISPENKMRLFKQNVQRTNRYGWNLPDGTKIKNLVQPSTAGFKKIQTLFEEHPELSAGHLLNALGGCLKVIHMQEEPEGFDKHWASRQGDNLEKFAKLLERIVTELDLFSECPVGAAV